MKIVITAALAVLALSGAAQAASVTNRDASAVTIIVTEGSERVELAVGPGETVEFCAGGCFVEVGGNNEVLTGAETVEINGGALAFK